MPILSDNAMISLSSSDGNTMVHPELYIPGLKAPFSDYGAEFRFIEQAKRLMSPCFIWFLGENKSSVRDVYKFYEKQGEFNRDKMEVDLVNIDLKSLTTEFFFHLYDFEIDKIWIFHPYLTNPFRLPESDLKYCIISINTSYKMQSYAYYNTRKQ